MQRHPWIFREKTTYRCFIDLLWPFVWVAPACLFSCRCTSQQWMLCNVVHQYIRYFSGCSFLVLIWLSFGIQRVCFRTTVVSTVSRQNGRRIKQRIPTNIHFWIFTGSDIVLMTPQFLRGRLLPTVGVLTRFWMHLGLEKQVLSTWPAWSSNTIMCRGCLIFYTLQCWPQTLEVLLPISRVPMRHFDHLQKGTCLHSPYLGRCT